MLRFIAQQKMYSVEMYVPNGIFVEYIADR